MTAPVSTAEPPASKRAAAPLPSDDARLRALAAENAALRLAIERLPHGLCMFDGADRLVLANRRYREIWDLPEALMRPGTPFADILAATRGREAEWSRLAELPPPDRDRTRRREWVMDDGRTISIVVTRLADGTAIAVHEDVTEQRRTEARIAHLARHDALTGLVNRAVLREELERLLARNARGEDLALLYLDLDRFKAVNDSHGHPVGDELLREVAARLRGCVRDTDLVARLGGDEFAIAQCGAPQPTASRRLAQRLIEALSAPFEIAGVQAHIGTSVGIAVAPFDGDDPDTLLKNADLALYRAKADGRGALRYFEPAMDERARRRRTLEADLRAALALQQFHLEYQPVVRVADAAVCGVEALLRWRHPVRGEVSPAEFVPLAEDTGLIVPIGRWVLEQACRDALRWPASVRVAVNVSAVQFRHGALLRDVAHALAHSGLAAGRLELEITESVMLREPAQAVAQLAQLRAHGVGVALDDFGTGYSSLSTLHAFRFDRLKIDRSFVHDVERDAGARSIVRAVAGLGRSLGIATTIEGVETPEQLAIARDEGCIEAQGHLFSRPRPADAIAAFVASAAAGRSRAASPGSADV
ncbi:EAL domain-containing protein [Calidifontimicrobium sp. SYSU G02091]|uniref:putative bifunctional diguanylate cyclase/phosphodiesterase n=1 Tax=Calidifontimicrobium sp. SYSU G02091 TaxID=2926421 RepID=UPI001F5346A6|nr:EAL domain-containing protein [Calidifontimicrobium sp. SYSU G02091]MCI1192437.1 EAL domain-containing protein [Calidifontimicrobium sp. SYSU G02091]